LRGVGSANARKSSYGEKTVGGGGKKEDPMFWTEKGISKT